MQTNGTLSYVDAGGAFVSSALSAAEWSTLWTFEAGVRNPHRQREHLPDGRLRADLRR